VDNRHNWDDVLVGSLIGIGCAIGSYSFYFPSLLSPKCNEPLDARFTKLKEEAIKEADSADNSQTLSKENMV
jgi:diacylglycerol diphosphate phosphatase/phosphatidate phosphatase